jgi:hypothetical protein
MFVWFYLLAQHAQIAVAIVGGMLIIPFSISSVLSLFQSDRLASIATSIGFALMFVAAIIILLSLSCRIPSNFLIEMIITPTVITIAVVVGLHIYYKRRRKTTNIA